MKRIFILLAIVAAFVGCSKDNQTTAANNNCKAVYLIRETRTPSFAMVRIDTLQKDCKVCGTDLDRIQLKRDTAYLGSSIWVQYTALNTPCR